MAKKSALSESAGNRAASNINPATAGRLRNARSKELSVDFLHKGILKRDKAILSRAITLIESNSLQHQEKAGELIERCLPYATKSLRIGITGVPGVGKSTFIEALGMLLVDQGKKVAVLAVDPSSSISKGSILGDKTRMEFLVGHQNAFIRPSASGVNLGGVARKTRESILLCEAAGFDVLLIETVGVGQSETTVHSMTDFFLLLKLAGAGDELQGIKRGIIEMADAIVINKADGENEKAARQARAEFKRALKLYPLKRSGWTPQVLLASALQGSGIKEIWDMIVAYEDMVRSNQYFNINRQEQRKHWLLQSIDEHLKTSFYKDPAVREALAEQLEAVKANKISPFMAAKILIDIANS